jgi:hypothetical protein
MGSVEALIVNTVRRGQGQMAGLDLTALADSLTGGQVTAAEDQLTQLQLALKVSIFASIIAAGLASWALLTKRRV